MTIAIAYRPDDYGRAAVEFAVEEALRRDATVLVVNVVGPGPDGTTPPPADLSDVTARLDRAGIAHDVAQVEDPDVVGAVVDVLEDRGAELLVIGLRKRTPVGKLIMGAVAQRLMLDTSIPVVAVKAP
jgi:nucleotide-binding universal stress UspA family protein